MKIVLVEVSLRQELCVYVSLWQKNHAPSLCFLCALCGYFPPNGAAVLCLIWLKNRQNGNY